ncbi:GNAT family N-acetyltransferase [Streptomyces sp. 4F14]|uniref:GNAT family N-acetyltransferase n=1 Tax=Streptomyces sp. 4F14 TaxID=3394380 RepID=UPI003A894323
MNTENTVRPRTDDDLTACAEALAEVHRHDGYPVNWPENPGDWLTRAAGLGAWVAVLDGRIAGHVALDRGDEDDLAPGLWGDTAATAVVSRLFVAPEARGHGVGVRLMERAVAEARRRDLHPVLDVVASDSGAVALYERLGWRLLATVEQRWSPEQTVTVRCYAAPAAV